MGGRDQVLPATLKPQAIYICFVDAPTFQTYKIQSLFLLSISLF